MINSKIPAKIKRQFRMHYKSLKYSHKMSVNYMMNAWLCMDNNDLEEPDIQIIQILIIIESLRHEQ